MRGLRGVARNNCSPIGSAGGFICTSSIRRRCTDFGAGNLASGSCSAPSSHDPEARSDTITRSNAVRAEHDFRRSPATDASGRWSALDRPARHGEWSSVNAGLGWRVRERRSSVAWREMNYEILNFRGHRETDVLRFTTHRGDVRHLTRGTHRGREMTSPCAVAGNGTTFAWAALE
jgi:hypothetical protein